jgi:hypothetical protein
MMSGNKVGGAGGMDPQTKKAPHLHRHKETTSLEFVHPPTKHIPQSHHRTLFPGSLRVMALATSKRKFYKLLDDLSGPSKRPATAPPLSTATVTDRLPKRPRTLATATLRGGAAGSPGGGRTTVRLLSSTFESKAGTISGATTSSPSANASIGNSKESGAGTGGIGPAQAKLGGLPATYAPWSHEQFLERLRSFADLKRWRPKPPAVGEVAWARRGWEVVGEDEVACGFCGRHVTLRLDGGDGEEGAVEDKWWTAEAEEKLVGKYEALVVNGHSEECLWRAAGSKGSFGMLGVRRADGCR